MKSPASPSGSVAGRTVMEVVVIVCITALLVTLAIKAHSHSDRAKTDSLPSGVINGPAQIVTNTATGTNQPAPVSP